MLRKANVSYFWAGGGWLILWSWNKKHMKEAWRECRGSSSWERGPERSRDWWASKFVPQKCSCIGPRGRGVRMKELQGASTSALFSSAANLELSRSDVVYRRLSPASSHHSSLSSCQTPPASFSILFISCCWWCSAATCFQPIWKWSAAGRKELRRLYRP